MAGVGFAIHATVKYMAGKKRSEKEQEEKPERYGGYLDGEIITNSRS